MLLAVCTCLHVSYLSNFETLLSYEKEKASPTMLLLVTLCVTHISELEKPYRGGKYVDPEKG